MNQTIDLTTLSCMEQIFFLILHQIHIPILIYSTYFTNTIFVLSVDTHLQVKISNSNFLTKKSEVLKSFLMQFQDGLVYVIRMSDNKISKVSFMVLINIAWLQFKNKLRYIFQTINSSLKVTAIDCPVWLNIC